MNAGNESPSSDAADVKSTEQMSDSSGVRDTGRISTGDTVKVSENAPIHVGQDLTQYFPTSRQTFDALFDSDTGKLKDRDQLVEVPSDQYDECVELLRTAITKELVPGVSDPDQAESIIKSGEFTYAQVRNIAIAGNLDALAYDEQDESVSCSFSYAISFAIQFARGKWSGLSDADSIDGAATIGSETSFVAGLMARHPNLRRLTAAGSVAVRVNMNRLASSQIGRSVIERMTTATLGRATSGGMGFMGHLTKLLRSNFISAMLLALTMSIPDFYRAWISKRISWAQFGKTFAMNAAGVVGGVYGWFFGMYLGGILGDWLASGIGAAIIQYAWAFVGGLIGCIIAAVASRWTLDRLVDDDAVQLIELVNESVSDLATDFLLTEKEAEQLSVKLKSKLSAKWLRELYRAGAILKTDDEADHDQLMRDARCGFAREQLNAICADLIAEREPVKLPAADEIEIEIERVIEKAEKLAKSN